MKYYNFFKFLEDKGEKKIPIRVKLIQNPNYQITQADADDAFDLGLHNTPIKSLGNLTSVGSLYLGDTQIESLGNLTSVNWGLYLNNTQIKSLGNLTFVGKNLYLNNTPLSKKYTEEQIRSMVDVKGEIYL